MRSPGGGRSGRRSVAQHVLDAARAVEIGGIGLAALARKTRDDACLDARGLERKREALLHRPPRGVLGQPHHRRAPGLPQQGAARRLAVRTVERVAAVADDHPQPPVAIFAHGGEIDLGARQLDRRQGKAKRSRGLVPNQIFPVELGEIELVAHRAGNDQRLAGGNAQPAARFGGQHRDVARGEGDQPVLLAHRLEARRRDGLGIAAAKPGNEPRAAEDEAGQDQADGEKDEQRRALHDSRQMSAAAMTAPRFSRSKRCASTERAAAG